MLSRSPPVWCGALAGRCAHAAFAAGGKQSDEWLLASCSDPRQETPRPAKDSWVSTAEASPSPAASPIPSPHAAVPKR